MPELEPETEPQDPIASLHKMSTTAGAGSQEYVAINNVAIAAAILGVATALAFLGLPFLAFGLASIVCGAIAISQIRDSNGTQSGLGLAWLGILLSIALAGTVAAFSVTDYLREREEERQINAILEEMGRDIMAGDISKVYGRFEQDFQNIWKAEPFAQTWKSTQSFFGNVEYVRGNNIFQFGTAGNGSPTAATRAMIKFQKDTAPRGYNIFFRKVGGEWHISGVDLFAPQGPRRSG